MIAQSECAMLFSERIRLLQNTILLTRENYFLKLSLISNFISNFYFVYFLYNSFAILGKLSCGIKIFFMWLKQLTINYCPIRKCRAVFEENQVIAKQIDDKRESLYQKTLISSFISNFYCIYLLCNSIAKYWANWVVQ